MENALIKSTKLLGMYKLKDIENKKVIEWLEAKMEDLKNQESTRTDLEAEVYVASASAEQPELFEDDIHFKMNIKLFHRSPGLLEEYKDKQAMQQYVREIEEKYRNILWLTKDNEGQHLTQSNGSNGQEDYTSEHKYNLRVSYSTTNLGAFEDKFLKQTT